MIYRGILMIYQKRSIGNPPSGGPAGGPSPGGRRPGVNLPTTSQRVLGNVTVKGALRPCLRLSGKPDKPGARPLTGGRSEWPVISITGVLPW